METDWAERDRGERFVETERPRKSQSYLEVQMLASVAQNPSFGGSNQGSATFKHSWEIMCSFCHNSTLYTISL